MRTPIAKGEFYHVYNRGVEKRIIFVSQKDYQRFMVLLYLCNGTNRVHLSAIKSCDRNPSMLFCLDRGEQLVAIHAYSLMPNHFHLLLEPKRGDDSVSIFMQKIATAYTMYFNKLNDRSGGLFQGTYKSSHAGNERYLRYLFAYIHSNPFSTFGNMGIPSIEHTAAVMDYPYSSVLDYRGRIRPENTIVERSFFQEDCKDDEMLKGYFALWLTYHDGNRIQGLTLKDEKRSVIRPAQIQGKSQRDEEKEENYCS